LRQALTKSASQPIWIARRKPRATWIGRFL
jgi:hypothetical protein